MRKYIENFFEMQDYPEDASKALLEAYDKLMACDASRQVFEKYLGEYETTDFTCFGEFIVLAAKAGNEVEMDGRTTQFLCFVCALRHLKVMYEKRGLPLDVYYDTARDLRYKLMECYKMHGVWGSFVASWFYGAFVLDRFELGRLQYEFSKHFVTQEKLDYFGVELEWDKTPIINLHIPSSGPLTQEAVEDSLSRAYKFMGEFYPQYIIDGKMIVECESWLLIEDHERFLPEGSNIRRFMENFDIMHTRYDDGFNDCWRVFNVDWTGDASVLPRSTSLQRAYADWLEGGGRAGEGYGIFAYDGEKIINSKNN